MLTDVAPVTLHFKVDDSPRTIVEGSAVKLDMTAAGPFSTFAGAGAGAGGGGGAGCFFLQPTAKVRREMAKSVVAM
jgi:hypothetical protein